MIFSVFQKKIKFLGILDSSYCGIGATIRIGREMLCLLYAEYFKLREALKKNHIIFDRGQRVGCHSS